MKDVQGEEEIATLVPTLFDNVRVGSYKTSGAWEKSPTPHLTDYHDHHYLFYFIQGSKFRKLGGYTLVYNLIETKRWLTII